MKKKTLLTISLATCLASGALNAFAGNGNKALQKQVKPWISVMGQQKRTAMSHQLDLAGMAYQCVSSPHRAAFNPDHNQSASSWNMIEGPDKTTWFYTQHDVEKDFYIASTEIKFYNSNHNEMGGATLTVPDGKHVSRIVPYGPLTKKMFDKDDTTIEFMVHQHEVGENYLQIDSTFVYNLKGERVRAYDAANCILVDASKNEWDTYYRAIMDRTIEDNEKIYRKLDILKPMGWGDTEPTVEHSFMVDEDLLYYSDGPYLNVCVVDGEPYYVLSHYAKPYMSGYDETTFDPIVNPDNAYVLEVFDKDFARVDSFGVALDKPEEALYRFAEFGMFSDCDMSKNYFSDDDAMRYVITYYDYYSSDDSYTYKFEVVDGKGEPQKTICDNVSSTYFKLSSLKGHEDQYAFMQVIDEQQQIQMVDVPSCQKATLMPATINGDMITTNLNRCRKGDGYQYVVSMGTAVSDEDNNVIARIGWFNTDLSLDHYDSFNLGPNGQYCTPLLNNQTLDPFLFDTDNDYDIPFIAKIKRNDSEVIDNILFISHANGDTIATFKGEDDTTGRLLTVSLVGYDTNNPELFVCHYNVSTDIYDMNFYKLPFSRFANGGEGTEASPYLVSTLGDMLQMHIEPKAHYKMTNDIDMDWRTWRPVSQFEGSLDGNGYQLSNLYINTKEANAGLFGYLSTGSKVKNLNVANANIDVNNDNQYVGVIGGMAMTDTISNVHVHNSSIVDDGSEAWPVVGGLVGQAAVFSQITNSSFYNGYINVPASDNVGGIVGNTRTGTQVSCCAAKGSFTAQSSLGGIAGATGADSPVTDCHADVSLTAGSTIGGIVGDNGSRALVDRCISQGSIEALGARWGGVQSGGIVGSLASDWEEMGLAAITNCASAMSITVPETTDDTDATYHRIVGRTIANEELYGDEEPKTEKGLAGNYALADVLVNGNAIESADATSVEGASILQQDMTKDFFISLGYAFTDDGIDEASPWYYGYTMPVLFFEKGILASIDSSMLPNANDMKIVSGNNILSVDGAERICLYDLNGQMVANVKGSSISHINLPKGIYVVKAIGTAGKSITGKVML